MISDPHSAISYNATVIAPPPPPCFNVTLYGRHCARTTCIRTPSSETQSRKTSAHWSIWILVWKTTDRPMHSPPRSHSSCIQPLPGSCSLPQAREGTSETGPRSARAPGRWASGLRWRRSRLDLSQSGRAAIASPNANGSATTKGDRGSDPAPRPRRLRPQRQPRLLIRIPLPPSSHQQQHR